MRDISTGKKTVSYFRINNINEKLPTQLKNVLHTASMSVCTCMHMCKGIVLMAVLPQCAIIGCFNEQMPVKILG